ncbi:hypothetical protein PISL3812_00250 [Talaromyces islandicus]|uniref:BTB domain-containing protein n=1 Tax=Talaromyces islandicus TaxID=28573 RepID=A0A0U1LIT3_TALIS|nr:hypothetical protein PISL3812_00250 [Talaromyces islandicus]
MADYKKIVRSSQFTFRVGKDKEPMTIHAALLQGLSDPLHVLMNNGHMRESQAGVAILDDVEVEIFIGFCEYAYTGLYETPDFSPAQPAEPSSSQNSIDDNVPEPEPAEAEPEPVAEEPTNHEFWDGWDGWGSLTRRKKLREASKKGIPDRIVIPESEPEPHPSAVPNIVYPYDSLWERFRSLKFRSEPASPSSDPDVLFHAKLYVFATKYLIEDLRQQCLASMHRDLTNFSPNRENRSRILDLLDFTYTHTGRAEAGGESPLRDLVIHYVACEARTLADDEKLTEILDSNAEVGSDLVLKLVS